MHPNFEVQKMTEGQIHEAMSKCYTMKQHAADHNQQMMVHQLDLMIEAYRDELQTRELAAIQAKEKRERKGKTDEITFGEISKDDDFQDFKY